MEAHVSLHSKRPDIFNARRHIAGAHPYNKKDKDNDNSDDGYSTSIVTCNKWPNAPLHSETVLEWLFCLRWFALVQMSATAEGFDLLLLLAVVECELYSMPTSSRHCCCN